MRTLTFSKDALPDRNKDRYAVKRTVETPLKELIQHAEGFKGKATARPTTSKSALRALFKTFTREDFNNWCIDNDVTQYTIPWEDYFLAWRKASTQ